MSDPVTYTGVLPIGEHTAARLARLLADDQRQRRTRKGRRALNPWRHAVLVLRWFLDATRVAQLAVDNGIGRSTAYRYLHEGIDALAAAAPACTGRCWPRRRPDTPTSHSTASWCAPTGARPSAPAPDARGDIPQ